MTRETVLIFLGILIAISPYLGLPLTILDFVLPILGLLIIVIGIMYRRTDKLSLRHVASERALPVHTVHEVTED
jgi:hypothetical protein